MLPENVHHDPMLSGRARVFRDRREAGIVLARLLESYRGTHAVVLGIPAGGVPVAASAACELALPMDFFAVSKITLPWNTEAGYGAVAADGTWALNDRVVNGAGLDQRTIEAGIQRTTEKVRRRTREYRTLLTARDVRGATAIIVDDGLASGFTMRVGITALRKRGPASIVVAVPTGHLHAVVELAGQADEVYCANIREEAYFAVAAAYQRWTDVDEDEVALILSDISGEPPCD